MPKKTKIAILGIGAVGGYFGGFLAEKYTSSNTIKIIFIARELSAKIIKEKGLKIITPLAEKVVFPHLISNDPKEIGQIDFLICCVKSYDLAESLIPLKKCIHEHTVILPLLNGVDAKDIILSILPKANVWDGCVYIISRLIEPGVIFEGGKIHSLYFGSASVDKKLKQFESILLDAEIDCHLSENILQTIWEKFIFISVVASLTSYLDQPIGPILENEAHRKLAHILLLEIKAVANAHQIELATNIIEKTITTMERIPYETKSSMHSDFKKGGKTEYGSLTEYVVKLGKEMKVDTPEYEKILEALKNSTQ